MNIALLSESLQAFAILAEIERGVIDELALTQLESVFCNWQTSSIGSERFITSVEKSDIETEFVPSFIDIDASATTSAIGNTRKNTNSANSDALN